MSDLLQVVSRNGGYVLVSLSMKALSPVYAGFLRVKKKSRI
jgi:hypothetical protein